MYLKDLTLRGFKSFASATRFRFEPGITAIVGPNGSGKSNVVDALAWVMGEQGAKSLRGSAMSDVIFAGSNERGALGRAQVELTIDNSDGKLPIAYSEVTISRTMFRSGGSEYAINRQPVRLLDVQELLSDTGLGRQMHVVVGQGQLDAVLTASPQDRRAFIDEAAGVAKHRRRKERALRKLESMDVSLIRVLDLTEELRARLRPLARQAKAAREAEGVRQQTAYAKARLLADDLVSANDRLQRESASLLALRDQSASTSDKIAQAKEEQQRLERMLSKNQREIERASDRYRDFKEQAQRLLSITELARERAAGAARVPVAISDTAVSLAEEKAEEARVEAVKMQTSVIAAKTAYEKAVAEREKLERLSVLATKSVREQESRHEALLRDYQKNLRQQESARAAVENGKRQLAAAEARLGEAVLRQDAAQRNVAQSDSDASRVENPADRVTVQYEEAAAAEQIQRDRLQEAERTERTLAEDLSRFASRRDTLRASLAGRQEGENKKNENARKVSQIVENSNTLGRLESFLTIDRGWEEAISALLAAHGNALVLKNQDALWDLAAQLPGAADAKQALTTGFLVAGDGEQAQLSTDQEDPHENEGGPHAAPINDDLGNLLGRPALSVVSAEQSVGAALSRLLSGRWVANDNAAALRLLEKGGRQVHAVATKEGAVLSREFLRLRGEPGSSTLSLRGDLAEAERETAKAEKSLAGASAAVIDLRFALQKAAALREQSLNELRANDAKRAKRAQEEAKNRATLHAAQSEVRRLEAQTAEVRGALEAATLQLESFSVGQNREAPVSLEEAMSDARGELAAAQQRTQDAWQAENQLRMEWHIATERQTATDRQMRAFATQANSLREDRVRQLDREMKAKSTVAAAQTVANRAFEASVVAEAGAERALAGRTGLREHHDQLVARKDRVQQTLTRLEVSVAASSQNLLQAEVAHAQLEQTLADLISSTKTFVRDYASVLPDDLTAAEDLDDAAEDADVTEEFTPGEVTNSALPQLALKLISGFGPHLPWSEAESDPVPFTRELASAALRKAERTLSRLGVVNPLAIQEYEAAQSRYDFLLAQVEDLNQSKADLLALIREVDAQVKIAFNEAFESTAQNFERVFVRLFPGGTGRLELTDPADPLATGIEIYARPSGKRVTRLSLLSGGERSLAALAYLIAIFQARPSPFYILDEVEAALDDVNLSRVLSLLRDLGEQSQLLIITHQKRTMELADALYGVSMKSGVTAVMSHRMNSAE